MYPHNYAGWTYTCPFRYPQDTPNHRHPQLVPQPPQQRYPRSVTYRTQWSAENVTVHGPPAPVAVNSTAPTAESDKFEAVLDVDNFQPEEITVRVLGGNSVTVDCKHEKKAEGVALVLRHLSTKYLLPQGYDMNSVECYMSTDGFLSMFAPKASAGAVARGDWTVPIVQTGMRLNYEGV